MKYLSFNIMFSPFCWAFYFYIRRLCKDDSTSPVFNKLVGFDLRIGPLHLALHLPYFPPEFLGRAKAELAHWEFENKPKEPLLNTLPKKVV